jgi:hypothetical protein
MSREIVTSTHLAAHPDKVWEAVQTTRLLRYVSAPLVTFEAVDPPSFPEVWSEGEHLCALKLLGTLPIGEQVIGISYPPAEGQRRFLRDNGRSAGIRRWDHLITIEPEDGGTRYTDRLILDAGWRTPIVAAFAAQFYEHRQARWRKLIDEDQLGPMLQEVRGNR